MDEPLDVDTLVHGLLSGNESACKFAVFRLQALLGDPSFADAFVQSGDGLLALRRTVLETGGNTQAYALGSLNKLLELDMGWEIMDSFIVEKAVSVAVTQPLVNIVRNALTLLVLVVSRPLRAASPNLIITTSGFAALRPALQKHSGFLEALVARLSASDHGLCANALQLVNALMRDAVVNGGETEWPRFIKRLQDLGVIGGVGMLMRGDAVIDAGSPLAAAILEFQGLTKTLLRKWKSVRVNLELHEHKKALKTLHLLSKPEPYQPPPTSSHGEPTAGATKSTRKHHPEKWRRLGFETESPAWEFDETGYLGMMDLVDYAKRNEGTYSRLFMEQAVQPREQRCPIARASLAVTLILYEHFEIDENPLGLETDGVWDRRELLQQRVMDARASGNLDRLYRPLLLQWGRLHTAGVNAFVRLWKASAAEIDDFYKIEEVVRVVVERIVGAASRKLEVGKIEEQLRGATLETARKWQMESLDELYDDAWGNHLVPVREQLRHESMQFMKEQRIRCLLAGAWFPTTTSTTGMGTWRFARLHPTRKHLHYQDFISKGSGLPSVDALSQKVDLSTVTSVDSKVSAASELAARSSLVNGVGGDTHKESSPHTSTNGNHAAASTNSVVSTSVTKITLIGSSAADGKDEGVLLELFASNTTLASEWLDGLLMLLNQSPITKDTMRVVDLLEDWAVRLRMLNIRWEDMDWESLDVSAKDRPADRKPVPSREGLDGDYWYALPET